MQAELPKMRCANCGGCCGPVLCSGDEAVAIDAYVAEHGIKPRVPADAICGYRGDHGCMIYPVRPFICRLFGHVPKMFCECGRNVNISARQERQLMAAYVDEIQRTGRQPLPSALARALVAAWADAGKEGRR